MKTCSHCGGAVAEPGEVTGWAGKWCRCWVENGQIKSGFGTPYDSVSVEEFMRQQKQREHREFIKRPSYSHILNLCEQLTLPELKAFIELLKQMHDCASLASSPEGLKSK